MNVYEQLSVGIEDAHFTPLNDLFDRFNTTSMGLSSEEARLRRNSQVINLISSPSKLPKWLCCLFPCLKKTEKMVLFNSCIAKIATVRRESKYIKLDPTSLLCGDVICIVAGDVVPADVRLIEVCWM